jgi:hypothetical protein
MVPRSEIRRSATYLGWGSARTVDEVRVLFGDTTPSVWWTDQSGRSGRCSLSCFARRAVASDHNLKVHAMVPPVDPKAWDRCPPCTTDDDIRAMVDAVLKAEGLGPPSL